MQRWLFLVAMSAFVGCVQRAEFDRPGAVTLGGSSDGSSSGGSEIPDSTTSTSGDANSGSDPSDGSQTSGSDCPAGEQGCPCGPGDACEGELPCVGGLCLGCASCGSCGDDVCDANESCDNCQMDCGVCPGCGDGECAESESCSSCPIDCGVCPGCGDGDCGGHETCNSCEEDCGICDVCTGANSGDGWYCGTTLSGQPNLLYRCVGGADRRRSLRSAPRVRLQHEPRRLRRLGPVVLPKRVPQLHLRLPQLRRHHGLRVQRHLRSAGELRSQLADAVGELRARARA